MAKVLYALMMCAAVWPVGAAAQQMDYLASQRLEGAVVQLQDPLLAGGLATEAAKVMVSVGLPWPASAGAVIPHPDAVPSEFTVVPGAVVELVDIRLLLTQIAIQSGARDHAALVRAQGLRDHDVILLRGGFATLADLWTMSRDTPAQGFVTQTDDGIILTRPLAIWSDAGLTLGAADQLVLDRSSGTFIANFGWLDIAGGTIAGNDTDNTAEPPFRPFVMTAGQGSLTAEAAAFQTLGFGTSAVFGGLSVVNNGLVPSLRASAVTHSTVRDVVTIGLIGTTGAMLSGNWIKGATGPAILVSNSAQTTVADNRFTALQGPQSIRVTVGSVETRISGNLMTGTARLGILIDRGSHDVTIAQNLVVGSVTTGIGIDRATCVTIAGNLVANNGGTGISLTDTDETAVTDNAVLFNQGSGIVVRAQGPAASVSISGNVLMGNRDGLRGATVGAVVLGHNDLSGQMPRIFSGDFAPLTVNWLRTRGDVVAASEPSVMPCFGQGEG